MRWDEVMNGKPKPHPNTSLPEYGDVEKILLAKGKAWF